MTARTATALASEVGVSQSTLSLWMREYGRLGGRATEGSVAKWVQDWSPEQKLNAVSEEARRPTRGHRGHAIPETDGSQQMDRRRRSCRTDAAAGLALAGAPTNMASRPFGR